MDLVADENVDAPIVTASAARITASSTSGSWTRGSTTRRYWRQRVVSVKLCKKVIVAEVM